MKAIAILGATGSIGKQGLEVCRANEIQVRLLTCANNINELKKAICEFHPLWVYVEKEEARRELVDSFAEINFRQAFNKEALSFVDNYKLPLILQHEADIEACFLSQKIDGVLAAVVGMAGLNTVFYALKAGLNVALANKESLVMAGNILKKVAKDTGSLILPVDSEHAAIFQCLLAGKKEDINRIFLTASGGPFRTWTIEQMKDAKLSDALKHPTWKMGSKITIDSATLMNKGLEWIEAVHLFEVRPEQVEIIIHPQSKIHSMLEWKDGSILAEIGLSDMCRPIRQALFYPSRSIEKKNFFNPFLPENSKLEFYSPDFNKFPCLKLVKEAFNNLDVFPIILNVANEVAVSSFINGFCNFTDIYSTIEATLNHFYKKNLKKPNKLEEVFSLAEEVKTYLSHFLKQSVGSR